MENDACSPDCEVADEALIGFDAREGGEVDDRWDTGRRRAFLLRDDVVRPLAAGGTFTWPSVFDTGQASGMAEEQRRREGFAGIKTPQWIGANCGLWADLEQMRRYLGERADQLAYTLVAVSWISRLGFREDTPVGPYREPTAPRAPEPGWQRLGLDVADGSLVSGLSECGYTDEETPEARERWAGALNSHHLFEDEGAALDFAGFCDTRLPRHAPFFVFGVYRVA